MVVVTWVQIVAPAHCSEIVLHLPYACIVKQESLTLGIQTPSEVLVCTCHTHLQQVGHTGPDVWTVVEAFKRLVTCSTNRSNASTTIRTLSVYSMVTCMYRHFNGSADVWTLGHMFDQPFERLHNCSNTVCLQHGYVYRRSNSSAGIRTLGHVFDQPFERLHNCSNTICLQHGYMLLCCSFNDTSHAWPIFHGCLAEWFKAVFEQFN